MEQSKEGLEAVNDSLRTQLEEQNERGQVRDKCWTVVSVYS